MKTHTINPITWRHYGLIMVLGCWAIGATVLSYDRALVWAATKVGHGANYVVAKYAEPVVERVRMVEVPTAQEKQIVLGGEYIMTDETMAKLINGAVK